MYRGKYTHITFPSSVRAYGFANNLDNECKKIVNMPFMTKQL